MSSSKEKKDQKDLACEPTLESEADKELMFDLHDLRVIRDLAHKNFMEYSPQVIGEDNFATFCYLKATVDFLNTKGVKLEVQYPKNSK